MPDKEFPKKRESWGGYELMPGDSPDVILARIDERTRTLQSDVTELKETLGKNFVTQEAFKALVDKVSLHQKILFSVIGLVCLTVFGALFKLVILAH